MIEMTLTEWKAEAEKLFGEDMRKWQFMCSCCGHVQTLQDFLDAGIGKSEGRVYYSCIGRWIKGEGTMDNQKSPCDYTQGGLIHLGPVIVTIADGTKHYAFDFAREENNG